MYDWPSFEELAELENYSRAWYDVVNTWNDYMIYDTSWRNIDYEGENEIQIYKTNK
jgi:hypothetical protein